MRSADAFGAHAVIIPKDRAVGLNATVAKAASGAADSIAVISVTNLARALRDLKDRGVWLIGAEAGGAESLFDADLAGPLAWVLGAEGGGVGPRGAGGVPVRSGRDAPRAARAVRDVPRRSPGGPRAHDAVGRDLAPVSASCSRVGRAGRRRPVVRLRRPRDR